MLVIGGVVDAGREQHDRRIGRGGRRRDRFQRRQQLVGIVLDRRDAVAREQLREQPQHDLAVLQHVGDAGGRAGIVLEHVEGRGVDAHDVDAGDVDVDVVRDLLAVHLRPEHRILEHQVLRDHAGPEDLAPAVDVADIGVDRLHALLEAAAHEVPFGGGEDARHHVEGDQALLRVGLAIDREGDADALEDQLRLAPAVIEHLGRDLGRASATVRHRAGVRTRRRPSSRQKRPPLCMPPGAACALESPGIVVASRAPNQWQPAAGTGFAAALPRIWADNDHCGSALLRTAGATAFRSRSVHEKLLHALDHRLGRGIEPGHELLHVLAGRSAGSRPGSSRPRRGRPGSFMVASKARRSMVAILGGSPGGPANGRAMALGPIMRSSSCRSSGFDTRS